MDVADIGDLCKNVERAAEQVRATFRGRAETLEVLDRFWLLQDVLARVVEALDDDSYGIAAPCTGLVERVVSVLEGAESFHFSSIPAVKFTCAAINRSLLVIEAEQREAPRRNCGDGGVKVPKMVGTTGFGR